MPQSLKPWEINPQLTADRLATVAAIIRTVRADALNAHEPSKGDSAWGLGCRVYERTCDAIAKAAAMPEYRSWLRVLERSNLLFIFAIGDVPLRFYSGDPANPPARACRVFAAELEQIAFADLLPSIEGPDDADRYFRLIITTAGDLSVSQITLIQIDGAGEPHHPYPIPADGVVRVMPAPRRAGVELPPPSVGPARPAAEETAE